MILLGQGTGVRSFTLFSASPLPDVARSSLPRYSPNSAISRFIATGGHAPGSPPTMSVISTIVSPRITPMRLSLKRAIFISHLSTRARHAEQMRPFLHDLILELRTGFRDARKLVLPSPRPASIDHRPIALIGRPAQDRVQRRAPEIVDDLDALRRIAACRHRPDHVMQIGGIDVLIDDDHPAAGVNARPAIGRQHARLLRVPRIHLLDRHHVEEPPRARFVVPPALHARKPRFLDLVPDHRRL